MTVTTNVSKEKDAAKNEIASFSFETFVVTVISYSRDVRKRNPEQPVVVVA